MLILAVGGEKTDRHTPPQKLLVNQGRVVGALGFSLVSGEYLAFEAKAILLATGGLGQLYEITTNGKPLTGDGYAMAWEIGTKLVDMEMVQFLPLCFPYPKARRGVIIGMSSILGPNVKLYNGLGERYMHKYDPEREEYSTRDIVSRGNYTEIIEGRGTERGTIIVDTTQQDPDLLPEYRGALPIVFGRIAGQNAAIYARDKAQDGKMTLEHVWSYHKKLEKVGIVTDRIAPLLLPDYTNPEVRKRQLTAHYVRNPR